MGRDQSFTEYVELRWSVLYRLAVLLGGDQAAEALTRDSLLDAYARWPAIADSPARDRDVKQLLVRSAFRAADTGEGADPEVVRRAVLALRWYEGLPDPEIAAILGDAAGPGGLDVPVPADVTELVEELHRRAETPLPPLPPADDLVAAGRAARARRTRRAAGVAAAVALVVGAVVAVGTVLGPSDPAIPSTGPGPVSPLPKRVEDLPLGDPARVAYAAGRQLRLGADGVRLPEPPTSLVQAGDHVVIGYPSGRVEEIDARTGSRTVLTTSSAGAPVIDAGGRWVAWLRDADGPPVVVVGSLADGSRREQAVPGCCGEPVTVDGITRSGQLLVSTAHGTTSVWDLGVRPPAAASTRQDLDPVDGLDGLHVRQVVGEDVVVDATEPTGSGTTVGAVLGAAFVPSGTSAAPGSDYAVPGWILFTAADGSLHARLREEGPAEKNGAGRARDVALRLPADLVLRGVARERGTTAVLDVAAYRPEVGTGYLVRCELTTGACEYVAQVDGDHLLAR